MMSNVTFGYAGNPHPNFNKVQEAAWLVKSDATPVGVEATPDKRYFRVVSSSEYQQAMMSGRLVWTA